MNDTNYVRCKGTDYNSVLLKFFVFGSESYHSREDFLKVPELAINPLCDCIIHAFCTEE